MFTELAMSDTTQPIQSSPMPKWRVQISLGVTEKLEQAMKDAGFSSGDLRKDAQDFAESAFALLVWMIGELKEGKTIASVDEKNQKYTEFMSPFMDTL